MRLLIDSSKAGLAAFVAAVAVIAVAPEDAHGRGCPVGASQPTHASAQAKPRPNPLHGTFRCTAPR